MFDQVNQSLIPAFDAPYEASGEIPDQAPPTPTRKARHSTVFDDEEQGDMGGPPHGGRATR
jgi:hypothetical protein